MKSKTLTSALILLILSYSLTLSSQKVVDYHHLEMDQGLSERIVNHVVRDTKGYFYLFMDHLVQRFNGREFLDVSLSAFNSNNVNPASITQTASIGDYIVTYSSSDIERVFIIPSGGLHFQIAELPGRPVFVNDKILLFSKNNQGKYDLSSYKITNGSVVLDRTIISGMPFKSDQLALLRDTVYILDDYSMLYRFHKDSQEKLFSFEGKNLIASNENRVYIFSDNQIWIVSESEPELVSYEIPDDHHPVIVKSDRKGKLAVGFTNAMRRITQLIVIDTANYIHNFNNVLETNNTIRDFHADNFFYRWLLGTFNGLYSKSLLRSGIEWLHVRENVPKGNFGHIITGLTPHHSGNVIFTRQGRDIFHYDIKSASYNQILKKEAENYGVFIRNTRMTYSESYDLLAGLGYRTDAYSNLFLSSFNDEFYKKYLLPSKVRTIGIDQDDRIIMGGFYHDSEIGTLIKYCPVMDSVSVFMEKDVPVRSFLVDSQSGNYWIGTESGINYYEGPFEKMEEIAQSEGNLLPYTKDSRILSLSLYNDFILAGTYGQGLFIIDKNNKELKHQINSKDNLTNNMVAAAVADDFGNIWVSTYNGITVLDSNFNVIRTLFDFEGLSSRELNAEAYAKDGNGHIYFGTLNGVVKIDPKIVLDWEKSNGIAITKIELYEKGNIKRTSSLDSITFFSSIDSVIVHFEFPDYYEYPFYNYEVILTSSTSTDMNSKNGIGNMTFTNLPIGTNLFYFSTPHSNFSEQLVFEIKRDFRPLINVLSITLLVLLLSAAISYTIQRKNRLVAARKMEQEKKIANLRLESLRAQMNPHFIFNSLGAIQYFIQTNDTVKADDFLSSFAQLMRSILESSKSQSITLRDEIKQLKLYLQLEESRFEGKFEYQIEYDKDLNLELAIPPMIIQPFVENAVNHGLYNLEDRKGALFIRLKQLSETEIKIEIEDNGIGRKAAKKLRTSGHKSRGTELIRDRFKAINQSDLWRANYVIKDLEEDDKAIGTLIEINMKQLEDN